MNGEEIGLGDAIAAGNCKAYAVDCFAELHDLSDGYGMPQEFGVGFGGDHAYLNRPADEGFPGQEHLIGVGGEVFAGCVAEVEREMAADLMGEGLCKGGFDGSVAHWLTAPSSFANFILSNRLYSQFKKRIGEELRVLCGEGGFRVALSLIRSGMWCGCWRWGSRE